MGDKMDTCSDRSAPCSFPIDDMLTCYLEADDPPLRRPFPRAEVCVVASAFAAFLVSSGIVLLVFHHTLESEDSVLIRQVRVSSPVLALAFLSLAGFLIIACLLAYAIWRIMEVLDMANRYREHRELCAYEEMRASFRSQHSIKSAKRSH